MLNKFSGFALVQLKYGNYLGSGGYWNQLLRFVLNGLPGLRQYVLPPNVESSVLSGPYGHFVISGFMK